MTGSKMSGVDDAAIAEALAEWPSPVRSSASWDAAAERLLARISDPVPKSSLTAPAWQEAVVATAMRTPARDEAGAEVPGDDRQRPESTFASSDDFDAEWDAAAPDEDPLFLPPLPQGPDEPAEHVAPLDIPERRSGSVSPPMAGRSDADVTAEMPAEAPASMRRPAIQPGPPAPMPEASALPDAMSALPDATEPFPAATGASSEAVEPFTGAAEPFHDSVAARLPVPAEGPVQAAPAATLAPPPPPLESESTKRRRGQRTAFWGGLAVVVAACVVMLVKGKPPLPQEAPSAVSAASSAAPASSAAAPEAPGAAAPPPPNERTALVLDEKPAPSEEKPAPPPRAASAKKGAARRNAAAEAKLAKSKKDDALKPSSDPASDMRIAAAPTDPSGIVPQKPSNGAVQGALSAMLPKARACLRRDDALSRVTLVFDSSGKVQSSSLTGAAAGKPAEGCIRNALRQMKLPPFAEPKFSAIVTVRPL